MPPLSGLPMYPGDGAPDAGEDVRAARRRQLAGWDAALRDPISRRRFLQLMGASLALAGAACAAPPEKIVPYVRAPEQAIPGKPRFYATAATFGGYGLGVLVESHLGRPTKVEGNPNHPASLGATDAYAQASVLTLYDPDRSRVVTFQGRIRPWAAFLTELRTLLGAQAASQGAGLRILTETVTSPTLADQLRGILARYPAARWHVYEPAGRDNTRAGAQLASGQPLAVRYRFDAADVVLGLDADALDWAPGSVRYRHDLAARRRPEAGLSRLYAVESAPSLLGMSADHRLAVRAGEVEPLARALAAALGVDVGADRGRLPAGLSDAELAALARDLTAHRGRSLVVVGEPQPPVVHAIGHALNAALGNLGTTVELTDPVEALPPGAETGADVGLRPLVEDMAAGRVQVLVILGGNPAYTAPADLGFADALARVGTRIRLGLYEDETSALCQWHIPEAHPLETWSDVRAYDGTVTIVQPLIAPLYGGRSAHELLAAFSDQPEQPGHDIVKAYWQRQRPAGDFERFWQTALHDGVVLDTALPVRAAAPRPDWAAAAATAPGSAAGSPAAPPAAPPAGTLELVFRPDPSVHDGRLANNAWLQELPKPLTKLTWDNAALLSPATAGRLGVGDQDVVELDAGGRTVRAPVLVVPGHADDTVTVTLGYGRRRGAGAATGNGFDAYQLRTAAAPWFAGGLVVRPAGARYRLAVTQGHHRMEGREIVRVETPGQPSGEPGRRAEAQRLPGSDSFYPGWEDPGYAWGMAIDLSACLGCNACIVACQAENNIPVVGKEEVLREREMHWLRVDSYAVEGPAGDSDGWLAHQPVPCMQCETAPCELVCPVGATVHSGEGLNDMVYNRCVGTRYCSNNCPYKVRRFNFFEFADFTTESLKLQRNPDVTVRSRGVMEKCTYCVQRISAARIQAEKEGRTVRDGEVLTACQAACPTEAIVFGDLNDPSSRVARLKASARNYALLAELNTRPRTTYLSLVRNPNPELAGGQA